MLFLSVSKAASQDIHKMCEVGRAFQNETRCCDPELWVAAHEYKKLDKTVAYINGMQIAWNSRSV